MHYVLNCVNLYSLLSIHIVFLFINKKELAFTLTLNITLLYNFSSPILIYLSTKKFELRITLTGGFADKIIDTLL